jgi:hypothetical protein
MKTRRAATPGLRRMLHGSILALSLAAVSSTLVAPAFADEWRHDGDGAREHEWREHDEHERRADIEHGYRWYAPGYAYNYGYVAPSYVPAPTYSTPVPLFNFGFEFR